ncbi:Uncharacterised protein [uncultured archaeon]|nr:Uncharacterised protein [uncultured archaeon]
MMGERMEILPGKSEAIREAILEGDWASIGVLCSGQ